MKSSHSCDCEVEDVADHDAEAELEQGDRDAQLDREHACEDDDCG